MRTRSFCVLPALLLACSSDPAASARTAYNASSEACRLYRRGVTAGTVKASPETDKACSAVEGLCSAPAAP